MDSLDDDPQDLGPMIPGLNKYERAELDLILAKPDRRKITLENYIIVWGSHKKLIDANKEGVNSLLPIRPSRESVRLKYGRGISNHFVLQRLAIEEAEKSGLIDKMIEREYMDKLLDKVSILQYWVTQKKLVDWDKLSKYTNTYLPVQGGAMRRYNVR